MAASTHGEDDFAAPRRGGSHREPTRRRAAALVPGGGPDTAPIEALVEHGMRLRFRAPELAMVFGERAAALAEAAGTERLWAYAEGLAVFARIRLGQRASVVHRAVVVLRTAEADGHQDLAALMRTELALCARSVGVPLTGLAALRPVLADEDASAAYRAAALLQLVGCMAPLGRRGVLDRALREADELASKVSMEDTDRVVLQALVCTGAAAHQRRYGDMAASMESTQRGLTLLDDGLGDDAADGVYVRVRLTLELVCALLDRGDTAEAAATAAPLLAGPMRAAAVAPMAWLRLAVATRIHLPDGAAKAANMLVRDALYSTQRHELKALTGRLWLELAHIEESLDRPADALLCLREARMNEHAYGRERRQALGLLIGEFGRGEQHVVDFPRAADEATRGARAMPPQPVAESQPVPESQPEPEPQRVAETPAPAADPSSEVAGSKHRSEGEQTARSVLERLGVTVGSGGRRRARDEPGEPEQAAPESAPPKAEQVKEPEPAEQAVEQQAAEEPPVERKRKDLDSVLAVFSNWTDDDESAEPYVVKPRVRSRLRDEGGTGPEAFATNGRVVNGDESITGKHRGEN